VDEPDVHELSHARRYSDETAELLELLVANGGPATAVGSALQTSSLASGSGVVLSVPVSGISSAASGSGSACGIGGPSDDRTSDERPAGWSRSLGFALGSTFGALGNSTSLEDLLGEDSLGFVPVSGISSAASGSGGSACGLDDRTSDERPAGWRESLGFALGSTFGFGAPGNSASFEDSLGLVNNRLTPMGPDLYIRHRSRSPVRHGRLTSGISSGGIGGLFPVGRGFMEALSGQHRHRQSAFSLISRADMDRAYEQAGNRFVRCGARRRRFTLGSRRIQADVSRSTSVLTRVGRAWSCLWRRSAARRRRTSRGDC